MFDTHCHLNFEVFNNTFDSVIKNAKKEGVKKMLLSGTDLETSKKAVGIASMYEGLYASVGIHPTKDLDALDLKKTMRQLRKMSENTKVVAIGEIGLDNFRFRSKKAIQISFFEEQLNLGLELGKSVIIHNRSAGEDILKVLTGDWDDRLNSKTVFHCCEADYDVLNFAEKHNIFIGIDGDVTYDKKKQDFVKRIPNELLVVETDSPYITPEPLRSQKAFSNEPANLKIILEFMAKLRGVEFGELEQITTKNSMILFRLA